VRLGVGRKCHLPRGSFYAFPDISKTGMNEKDFAIGLLQTEKVAIVPGSAFGENGKGFCRACFATSYEQLVEAATRMLLEAVTSTGSSAAND